MKVARNVSVILTLLTLVAFLATGCGNDNSKAGELVNAQNATWTDVSAKNDNLTLLVSQITTEVGAGQTEQITATLNQAQDLVNQMKTESAQVRSAFIEASNMKVDDVYSSYLQARIEMLDNYDQMWTTDTQLINLWLSDPLLQNPATAQQIDELTKQEQQQLSQAKDASDRADQIAAENPGKFQ